MNILVAGGGGFIGSNLCAKLLNQGHRVWAIDCFHTGEPSNLESLLDNPNFVFGEVGIETPAFMEFCKNAGVKFDRVYDLACPTGVPNIETLGEEMLDACSTGTKQALIVAREHNARFLLTSSSEIYGDPQMHPQPEHYSGNVDPLGWRANYEEGKRFAETTAALFAKKYGVQATMVRLFNVYGPKMALRDFRVIPRFAVQALKHEPVTVHGDGLQRRTLCYVDDLLEGLELVMENGKPAEVYNLGSDQEITMLKLAQTLIAAANSKSELIFVPRATHDHESRMPVLTKVQSLGWKQKIPLDMGLSLTLEDFKARLAKQTLKPVASQAGDFATR